MSPLKFKIQLYIFTHKKYGEIGHGKTSYKLT